MLSADEVRERKLSAYAFCKYGNDAKLYNGIHDLETALLRDAEIARLAREWAKAFQQCDDPNHTDEYREARRALIAAVEQEER